MHQNRLAECEILEFSAKKRGQSSKLDFLFNVKDKGMCALKLMCVAVSIKVYGI